MDLREDEGKRSELVIISKFFNNFGLCGIKICGSSWGRMWDKEG